MSRARQTDIEEIDLEALVWERHPQGPALAASDLTVLAAAVGLYAKHLQTLAVDAQKLGRDAEAGKFQREADALTYELVGDEEADPPHRGRLQQHAPRILPGHRQPIAKGLEFYLKNLRAAKGTVRGLGKDYLAEEWEEEAQLVEQRLLPLFQDQGMLPLKQPAPVSNLKEVAEAEAERVEQTEGELLPADGTAGVLPMEHKPERRRRRAAK